MTKRKPTPSTAAAALAAFDAANAAHAAAAEDLDMASARNRSIQAGDHSPVAKEATVALLRDCEEKRRVALAALHVAMDGLDLFLAHEDETVAEMRERLGLAA